VKITGVSIKDFLILKEVEFAPDPEWNLIVGKNMQGKSSILKAIEAFFKGADPSVVRKGADKSEIMISLDNGYWGRRIIRKNGNKNSKDFEIYLNEDKDKKGSPKEWVDKIIGTHAFNPVELIVSKDRTKYLKDLFTPKATPELLRECGVEEDVISARDFSKDGFAVGKDCEDLYFRERTGVNKTKTMKQGAYDEAMSKLPQDFNPEDFKPETLDALKSEVENLKEQKTQAEILKKRQESDAVTIRRLRSEIESYERNRISIAPEANLRRYGIIKRQRAMETMHLIYDLERQLQKAKDLLETTQNDISDIDDELAECSRLNGLIRNRKEMLASLEIEVPSQNLEEIVKQYNDKLADLLAVEAAKAHHDNYQKIQTELKPELEAAKKESERLTVIIEKLREHLPAKLIENAKIPIPGLRIENDSAFIDDRSLDHLSGMETIDLAVSVFEKLNENVELKAICLDGIEKMDPEQRAAFREKVRGKGFELFMTLVQHTDEPDPGAIVVEDGAIKNPKKQDLKQDSLF
jgi:DNA repair ATPase RecN